MTIDKQALREAAEKAGKDKWQAKKINGDFYVIRSGSYIKQCGITSFQPIAEIDHKPVRDFVAMVNPATTLALLDENLQLQREKDAIEAVALALRDDMRQAREQLEAAEKRINDYHTVLNNLAAVARRYLPDYDEHPDIQAADDLLESAAGIGVKQQEDSVDSDVGSRNQPGMVVAVHIGAGDFVKVKGQVFEVEETDFDDHDVTLWFVGGNALKCAAGCPVEVVSAPVAAGIKVKGE
ncbi:ead/Ea22-like family protein [Salmonella enterica subsp. enterica serovar Enteritidis]|nr:ead/Ea22-like family protein [Salmonella enterica subsp. enterica serovar Enteritidis]